MTNQEQYYKNEKILRHRRWAIEKMYCEEEIHKIKHLPQKSKKAEEHVQFANNVELAKIIAFYGQGNFRFAFHCLKSYVNQYPKDMIAKYWLAKFNSIAGFHDVAREIYLDLLDLMFRSPKTALPLQKIVRNLLFLEIDQENYEKAYEYYQTLDTLRVQYPNQTVHFDFANTLLFLKSRLENSKKLKYNIPRRREDYDYLGRQILGYQRDDYWKHLKRLSQGNWESLDSALYSHESFNPFANWATVFYLSKRIESVLPYANQMPSFSPFTTFSFEIPNVGVSASEWVHSLQVLTLPKEGIYQMVSMYPFRTSKALIQKNNLEELELKRKRSLESRK